MPWAIFLDSLGTGKLQTVSRGVIPVRLSWLRHKGPEHICPGVKKSILQIPSIAACENYLYLS